jgi:hypothetical protein
MAKPDKRAIRRLIDAALREKFAEVRHKKNKEKIFERLAVLGVSFKDEWEPTDGGGSSWLAQGTDIYARVTYPAARLKDAIDAGAKAFIPIRKAAGDVFKHLFEAANFYKPVAKFREKAVELLGKEKSAKLIGLCEVDNEPKVSFEAGKVEDREAA